MMSVAVLKGGARENNSFLQVSLSSSSDQYHPYLLMNVTSARLGKTLWLPRLSYKSGNC